jgi:hypothetical protein
MFQMSSIVAFEKLLTRTQKRQVREPLKFWDFFGIFERSGYFTECFLLNGLVEDMQGNT